MQQATPLKTARASPGTRGPTAAHARRARKARTRTRRGPQHAPHAPATPRRLQVCAASLCRTRWRMNANAAEDECIHSLGLMHSIMYTSECIYIRMSIHMYIYIHSLVCIYVYIYASYVCMYSFMYARIHCMQVVLIDRQSLVYV